MAHVTAISHVAFEDLGLIQPLLEQRGHTITMLDATQADLSTATFTDPDLLIVLGGPIGVYDDDTFPFLSSEIAGVRHRLNQHKPTLGICLGAQIMARALGADVGPSGHVEIGYAPLQIADIPANPLSELKDVPVVHWHGDMFDIPDGAHCLASTEKCPHQAFSLGEYALGLQFHLEVRPRDLERWFVGHSVELAAHGISVGDLRKRAAELGQDTVRAGQVVISRWLDAIGL